MGNFCNNCDITKNSQDFRYQKNLIKPRKEFLDKYTKKIDKDRNQFFIHTDKLSSFSNHSLKKHDKNILTNEKEENSLELINSFSNDLIIVDNNNVSIPATKIIRFIRGCLYRIKFNKNIKIDLIKQQNKLYEDITKNININSYIQKYFSSKNIYIINNENINKMNIFHLLNHLKIFLYKKMKLKDDSNNKIKNNDSIQIVYDRKYYIYKSHLSSQNDNDNINKINNMIKIYYGRFNKDEFIEGIIINIVNKVILIGEFNEQEIINGKGIKINYNTKNKENYLYYGDLKDCNINGVGKIIFLSAMEKYKGNFLNEKFHGEGHFYFKNGTQYKGFFNYGEITGYGVLLKNNGDKYEGKFLNGLLHGNGKIILANGNIYACEFEYGKIKGKGYCIQDEGSLFNENIKTWNILFY
jgi:hypothetical protein